MGWVGLCYLGVFFLGLLPLKEPTDLRASTPARLYKQEILHNGWYQFFWNSVPSSPLWEQCKQFSGFLESLANTTADGLEVIGAELTVIRTTVLQNRVTLDYLLTKEGGACKLIGKSYCILIPDSNQSLFNDISRRQRAVAEGLGDTLWVFWYRRFLEYTSQNVFRLWRENLNVTSYYILYYCAPLPHRYIDKEVCVLPLS